MYSDKVMDHFTNPRNVGEIENADGVGQVGNAKCGDIMKMYLKIEDGIIVDAKFKTFGCGAAVATSSMATELIKGKTIKEAEMITNKAVLEALDGLPPQRFIVRFSLRRLLRQPFRITVQETAWKLITWDAADAVEDATEQATMMKTARLNQEFDLPVLKRVCDLI